MNIIQTLTKNCANSNCRLVQGVSTITCMAWAIEYDKNGNPLGRDPNYSTSEYRCSTCGKKWSVRTGGFNYTETITEY
jgi:hypothetical protein